MFKQFSRNGTTTTTATATKMQFSESSPHPPVSANNKAYASNIKRHSSMRQHTSANFFLDNVSEVDKPYSNHKFLAAKKYVSCENVRQSLDTDDFQEISGDDDDENSIKEKLMKRYNSLTTLLMKSFRKAKSKKKKSSDMAQALPAHHGSQLETNFEEDASGDMVYMPSNMKTGSLASNLKSQFEPRSQLTSAPKFSGGGEFVREKNKSMHHRSRPAEKNESENVVNNNGEGRTRKSIPPPANNAATSGDSSTPVFKGVKMISNEFVDLKPNATPHLKRLSLNEQPDTRSNTGLGNENRTFL